MSKLSMSIQSEPLLPNNKQVMVQVGWLGQTGEVYPLHIAHGEIAKTEKGSYAPIYMPIGQWELNQDYQYVIHD
jgi:hypothetical protein